jgi:high-affinity iron transporter
MFLIGAALLLQAVSPDSAALARRIASAADLAVAEYRLGVVDGRIVAAEEVEEARLFLGEAGRRAEALPAHVSAEAAATLATALRWVERTGPADSVAAAVAQLHLTLTRGLGVSLVEYPTRPPLLAHGAELYRRECASCHGDAGLGDGPAARGLDPAPANLADFESLLDVTPLAFYQRITIGVAGTAMPAYEAMLSPADRWAVAAYATTLRQGAPHGSVPASLTDFPRLAAMNDAEILTALGGGATHAQLAAVRHWQPADDPGRFAAIFGAVRGQINTASERAAAGDHDGAKSAAFDAYLAFEEVERAVRVADAALATSLEASFADLRTQVSVPTVPARRDAVTRELLGGLERAERAIADRPSQGNLFVQSLMILLREGLEAILIIGALLTFLTKIGAAHRRQDIHVGVGAAIILSVITAVLLETVFHLSAAQQEVLEGITMLVAVGVLFYVSYWLLSKMEVAKWTAFVKGRVADAVSGGSAFALATAAFLAVYREGFETILFYKALLVSGGSGGGTFWPVTLGVLAGSAILAVVYVAITRWGVKLPLKPFFAVTSTFLYYTAFVFAGKGIAELQAGGVVGTSVLPGWPRLPALGIYPTVETLLAQGVLLVLALGAVGYVLTRREEMVGEAVVGEEALEGVGHRA